MCRTTQRTNRDENIRIIHPIFSGITPKRMKTSNTIQNSGAALRPGLYRMLPWLLCIRIFCSGMPGAYGCSVFGVQAPQLQCCYGDTLQVALINPEAHPVAWNIRAVGTSKIIASGTGNIAAYTFTAPGRYQVVFRMAEHKHDASTETGSEHSKSSDTTMVQVFPTRMVFDYSEAKLSGDIKAGKSTQGLTLTVPVTIATYSGAPVTYTPGLITTAGIHTNITATLTGSSATLAPGTYQLTFTLDGRIAQPGYVMFDIPDVNGQVQVYNHPEAIY